MEIASQIFQDIHAAERDAEDITEFLFMLDKIEKKWTDARA